MKKSFFLIIMSFLIYSKAKSQCSPAIPSTAVVVDSTLTINGGFDPIWACSGDTIHSDGGFHNIYLEPGAVMTTGGGIDTIFVKNTATLIMNGGIHYIYYENNLDLIIAGGIPTLDSCPAMSFDYSNAPVNGCFTGPIAYFHSNDSVLCAGDSIDFINQSLNGITWQWDFQGGTPSSSTIKNPQNIHYNTAGSFDVTLIVFNGNGSDTLTLSNFITVNAVPNVTATQNGNVLSVTSGYSSYQWYFGNVLLNGAVFTTLTAFSNGTYFVHVADTNGCDTTVAIIFNSQGINEFAQTDFPFIISPNPAKDFFVIRMNTNFAQNNFNTAEIELINMFGQIVLSQPIDLNSTTEITLKNISAGIYFVKVNAGEKLFVQKLVVE